MPVAGLTIGRVVHYTPSTKEIKEIGVGPFAARVSRVDDPDVGHSSLHIDLVDDAGDDEIVFEQDSIHGLTAFKARVPFDPDGKTPGSWRWPPRV